MHSLRPLSAAFVAALGMLNYLVPPALAGSSTTHSVCSSVARGQFIGADGIETFAVRPFTGGLMDKAPAFFTDRFASMDHSRWHWTNYGDSCLSAGSGLAASIPLHAANYTYSNAEILTTSAYPAKPPSASMGTTAMTTVVRGANLAGVEGTRGWGFWNTSLVQPLSGVAFFMDVQGPLGSSQFEGKAVPPGFYAVVQRAGQTPVVHRLNAQFLRTQHAYTVALTRHGVVFGIDGRQVFTTPTLPSVRMPARVWVDNAGYKSVSVGGLPLLFLPQFLPSPVASRLQVQSVTITNR